MDIYAKPGTKVVFTEKNVSRAQINWGSHADPREILKVGQQYIIDHTDVRSYHTKVFLVGFQGKSFNSVWFK